MIPDPRDKSLYWFNILNNYETCQWYVLNVVRRSYSVAEIRRYAKEWLKKTGILIERPSYAM